MPTTTLSNYTQQQLDIAAVAAFIIGVGGAVFFGRRAVRIWKGGA